MAALRYSCKTHKRVFSEQKYYHWWVSLFPIAHSFFLLLYAAVMRHLVFFFFFFCAATSFLFSFFFFFFFYLHLTYLISKNLLNLVEFLINGKYGVERGSERDRESERLVCVCVCVCVEESKRKGK